MYACTASVVHLYRRTAFFTLYLTLCFEQEELVYMLFTQYPDIMSISDLRSALGIGRTKAYELVSSGEIRSIKVGKAIRIPKTSLLDYVKERSYNTGEVNRPPFHEGGIQ